MVTRVNSESDMRDQVFTQMFSSPKALSVAAGILLIMGVIPGMPHFAFLSLSAGCAAAALWIARNSQAKERAAVAEQEQQRENERQEVAPPPELGWDDVAPVDMIGLEVGYRLIPMVDKNQTGELLSRIKGIRKKLSQDIGFLVPAVHIRDNLELQPNSYRITINGVIVGESEVRPEQSLAINPGQVFGKVDGVQTTDPAFGLEAIWVDAVNKDQAQSLGYTVVDASTVVATHLNQLLQRHVDEFLGHEEVQQMLDRLGSHSPRLADALVPDAVPMNMLIKVLRSLLLEDVPIRDFRTIAEAIAANGHLNQDHPRLTESVRVALRRTIVQEIFGGENNLPVTTLDAQMEQLLNGSVVAQTTELTLEPGLAERLQRAMEQLAIDKETSGSPAVLLVAATLRPFLSRMARYCSHKLHVISYNEIPDDKQITIEGALA